MYRLRITLKPNIIKTLLTGFALLLLLVLTFTPSANANTTGQFGPGECNNVNHQHYFDRDSGTCLDGRAPVGGDNSASDSASENSSFDPALDQGTSGRPVLGIIPVPSGFPTDPSTIIASAVTVLLGFAGLIFFIVLLLGGLRYLTAGGDEKATIAARQTLTNAFIGLVIVVASFLIAQILFAVFGLDALVNVI